MPLPTRKPLYFNASSWKDLKALPGPVHDTFGTLLLDVQYGETPESAKPLKGFVEPVFWRSLTTTTATRAPRARHATTPS